MSSPDKHHGESSSKRRRSSSSAKPRRRRSRLHLKVTRPVYTESEFQKGYHHSDHHHFPLVQIQNRFQQINCRLKLTDVGKFLVSLVPIIHWLPRYSVKSSLLRDIIAGCTIGVMRIPQGEHFIVNVL